MKIKEVIKKKEGRDLILRLPMNKVKYISEVSIFNNKLNTLDNKYLIKYKDKIWVNIESHIAILSLFNDCCAICGKHFTHYILASIPNRVRTSDGQPIYDLYPCLFNKETNKPLYFNRDHIIPQSCNGDNSLRNLQFTCEDCNNQKGNRFTEEEINYGYYKEGIFAGVMVGDNVWFDNILTTIESIDQVKGGLFFVVTPAYTGYFMANGQTLNTQHMIRRVR